MLSRKLLVATLAGLPASLALAGPLNPPAGPVTSTHKTLTEVEPRIAINATNTPADFDAKHVITQPGSYYLTGNMAATPGKKGIKIQASGVTIDLNGFTMSGLGTGDDAIYSDFGSANVTVRNGSIVGWVKEGIDGYYSNNCRIENVIVEGSVNGFGIITGTNSVITGCTVRSSGAGIVTTASTTVRDCTAVGNGGAGFATGWGNTLIGCSAGDTTAGPGFQTAPGTTVSMCTAQHNLGGTGHGFDLAGGNTVTGCTSANNDMDGFHVQTGESNALITGCNANTNRGHGIRVENGVGHTISANNCSRNNGNGIQVSGGSAVLNNTCENNGTLVGASTSGIYVTFSYNRVDGNTVLASAFGINVAAGGSNNVVIRNTVTLCTTPYSLPAGTAYGTINFLPSGAFSDTNTFANLRY